MNLVNIFRLYRSKDRNAVKLATKKALYIIHFKCIDTLLNHNLLYEAGLYTYNLLYKFGKKKYMEYSSTSNLLNQIPCKGKYFLESILNTTKDIIKGIIIKYNNLRET